MDYTAIIAAITFAGPLTVVAAAGAALAGIYVAIKGVTIALGAIRGRG